MSSIAALNLISPSSVVATGVGSSASIGATGEVTWSTCVTMSINGCFSATYENYLILMRGTSTDYTIVHNWRVSGVDATGTDYITQRSFASASTLTNSRFSSETFARCTVWDADPQGASFYIYGPALTQPTVYRTITVSSMSDAYIADHAGTHGLSTAYDGITLGTQGGGSTFSGTLVIYGLAE